MLNNQLKNCKLNSAFLQAWDENCSLYLVNFMEFQTEENLSFFCTEPITFKKVMWGRKAPL